MKKFIFILVLTLIGITGKAQTEDTYETFYYDEFSCHSYEYQNLGKINLTEQTQENAILVLLDTDRKNLVSYVKQYNDNRALFYSSINTCKKEKIKKGMYEVFGMTYLGYSQNRKDNLVTEDLISYDGYIVSRGNKYYFLAGKFLSQNSLLMNLLVKANAYPMFLEAYNATSDSVKVYSELEKLAFIDYKKSVFRDSVYAYVDAQTNIITTNINKEYQKPVDSLVALLNERYIIKKNYNETREKELPAYKKKLYLEKYFTDFEYYLGSQDYAGGCDLYFGGKNTSQKTIKYINVIVKFKNAVNDYVYCDIRGNRPCMLRYTGPCVSGEYFGGGWGDVIYNWSAKTAIITSLTIQYMDGTKVSFSQNDLDGYLKATNIITNYENDKADIVELERFLEEKENLNVEQKINKLNYHFFDEDLFDLVYKIDGFKNECYNKKQQKCGGITYEAERKYKYIIDLPDTNFNFVNPYTEKIEKMQALNDYSILKATEIRNELKSSFSKKNTRL